MIASLADELEAAYRGRRSDVVPPSARAAPFQLTDAYAVEAELMKRRVAGGRNVVGRKIGYANKAVWRVFNLETVVWGRMYDDTVIFASDNSTVLSLDGMIAPKIEPEIVFSLRSSPPEGPLDAAGVLAHVDWLALGFEIIDCVYPDWKFQPVDFVAAYGLHARLVVGDRQHVDERAIPELVQALATFTVALSKNGEVVANGAGRNVLKSPALSLAELVSAIRRRPAEDSLRPGEIVSSGTLTDSQRISRGDAWTAVVDNGINLPTLTCVCE